MLSGERARAQLYERLDEAVGHEAADTLMAYLPPVGWADVATKSDLAVLEERLALRIDGLEHRLEARFERALRQSILALVAAMITSVGAAVGITQLLT